MINRLFQTIVILFFFSAITAQSIWTDIDERQITNSRSSFQVNSYRTLELDIDGFEQILSKKEELSLPLPNGELASFRLQDAPFMEPALAAKYPTIKSYSIQHTSKTSISGRLTYTPNGVHAIIHHLDGLVFIEPLVEGASTYYASYFAKDQMVENFRDVQLSCGHSYEELSPTSSYQEGEMAPKGELASEITSSLSKRGAQSRSRGMPTDLTVYKLILSSTGEFANFHRARLKGEVLFEYGELLTFVNSVFERDFAIRFELIEETEDLIYLDAATDPYDGNGSVFSLVNQSSFAIETQVDVNRFDIGHILTADCFTGGGAVGVVAGLACSVGKSQGVSCQFQSNTVFATNIFAHELGHQLSASHSWSNCTGSEGQRASTPYEPGSGSTIMSYAGACGAENNIQQRADAYFHVANIEEVELFQESNADCGTQLSTGNIAPEAIILQEQDLVIPIRTPFELKGEGLDENGDDLTYCWEQYDLGPASILDAPRDNAPIIRSILPSINSNRIIPDLDNIIRNDFDNKEVLPTYTRDLTFRLTVRDNHPDAGGVDWEEVSFSAIETAGPFLVTFPNQGTDVVRVGESVNVQWEVANTNVAPVNCQKVDILLSIDGGRTYPEVLAREVDNDGSQIVTIPQITTNTARIKIAAADNIFFDISNNNFGILNPTQAGFSFATSIQSKEICLPEQVAIDLNTVSLLDYQNNIVFDIIEGLPEGAVANFQNTTTTPGGSNQLSIDFQNVTTEGDFEVDIRGVAPNADTIIRTIDFNLVSNDFSDLLLMMPANNSQGIASPSYVWQTSEDAITYDIEIATSPAFGNTIVDRATSLRTPEYPSRESLEPSTIYYWRVIPANECGVGEASEIFAFQTERLVCTTVESGQVPLFISAQGTPTVQSTLNFSSALEISDLNVIGLKGRHDQVRHIAVRLISPSGTTVTLMSGDCFSVPIDINFDDESLITEICPANDQQTKVPQQALSNFDGENANGTWTLEIEVLNTDGEGGSIDAWGLELCSNASVDPPILVTNNIMPVQPTKGRVITNEFLLSEDSNNAARELVYTVIALPSNGQLLFNGNPLAVGQTFTQADLDNNRLLYKNEENTIATQDAFRFDVTDGEGGWIGITSFEMVLDESELITDVEEVEDTELFTIFPNPVSEVVHLSISNIANQKLHLSLINSQGQLIYLDEFLSGSNSYQLDISHFPDGIYFVQVRLDNRFTTKKIIVQR